MPQGTLIYNPSSGRFPAGPLIKGVKKALAKGDWEVKVVESSSKASLVDHARQAVQRNDQVVFVAGGDGSVGTVASVLADTGTALAVLPAGTANVWAKELGLQHLDWWHWFALEDAAYRLTQGTYQLADLGVCNGKEFLLWAGMGLDAEIVRSIEPRGRWEKSLGTAQYATLAMWETLGWEGIQLQVSAPEVEIEGKFLVAVASNIRAYAGGFVELALHAKIDDGLLDFWLFEGTSFKDIAYHAIQVLRGTHVDAPGIFHFQAPSATFYAGDGLAIQLDGEPEMKDPPIELSVRKKVLRVLVPKGGNPKLFSSAMMDS
jgi:diacylglycerol kinase (ATP)